MIEDTGLRCEKRGSDVVGAGRNGLAIGIGWQQRPQECVGVGRLAEHGQLGREEQHRRDIPDPARTEDLAMTEALLGCTTGGGVQRLRRDIEAVPPVHGREVPPADDAGLTTFNAFADLRTQGGVTALTVRHGIEDPNFVAVDLEFDTTEQARSFLGRLQTEIWPNSPHITGEPTTQLLESAGATV